MIETDQLKPIQWFNLRFLQQPKDINAHERVKNSHMSQNFSPYMNSSLLIDARCLTQCIAHMLFS